jgi:hypothetical protein
MLVIADPQSWLDAEPGPPQPCNWRYGTVHEHLFPGDVTEDGALLRDDGALLVTGAMVVSSLQAYAAAYYGWRDSGLRIYRSGRVLVQVYRSET